MLKIVIPRGQRHGYRRSQGADASKRHSNLRSSNMLDLIERMASDRLWFYTSIAGSIAGAVCLAYLSTTRIGLWGYARFDKIIDFLVERWGLTWLEQPEDAWRNRYPKITAKIDELERRIQELEK
jgi:hypothetical protein